jgi:LmeA-like phospholipid-binding
MRRGDGNSAGGLARVGLLVVAVVVLLLVLAQVFLPGVAASRIRKRVGRYGTVQSVSVSAWPAVKLLWGDADSVTVRARSLKTSAAQTAKLLWDARGLGDMKLTAQASQVGALKLSDVSLEKHGKTLSGQARMTDADVKAALPEGFDVQFVKSEGGQVEVQASGGLFGIAASVNAVASASEGRLIARPRGFLVEALQLTLFSEPHIYVEGVGVQVERRQPLTYRLTMGASLR